MTSERRRSDPMHTAARLRTAETPHVASHVGAGVFIRVVKLGGRAQSDPILASRVQAAAAEPGARMVIVHGGGDEVSALQRELGIEPMFIGGRRVTTAQDLDLVRMVLSGRINKRLVAQLASAGARAVGVSGEDGDLLSARVDDARLGRVGREVFADATLIADLLNGGWLPVISPLAADREAKDGDGLNVNGDDAAAAIAAGLGADELLFVADVPGVLDDGVPLSTVSRSSIAALVQRGAVQGGMLAKLEAAVAALHNGVRHVRIASLDGLNDPTTGTSVTLDTPSTRNAE